MKGMDVGSEKKTEASEAPPDNHDMKGHNDNQMMKTEEPSHDLSGRDHMGMKIDGEHHDMSSVADMSDRGHHRGMMDNHERNQEGGVQVDHSQHISHNMAGMHHMNHAMEGYDMSAGTPANTRIEQPPNTPAKQHDMPHMDHMDHEAMHHSGMHHGTMHNMHMPSPDQPMFPTVTIAVCHCGAGCLLGDIVGEWLVFGTNATLGGKSIGPEFLIGIIPRLPSSKIYISSKTLILSNRLRIRPPIRHRLPILLHRAHVRRLRAQNALARRESGFPVTHLL
jgi:hypothetical protein